MRSAYHCPGCLVEWVNDPACWVCGGPGKRGIVPHTQVIPEASSTAYRPISADPWFEDAGAWTLHLYGLSFG